ncbi:MAG: glycosyltransferase family 4 protein, partial [Candidatus Desulfofervidaceae bacterium]|nr:glycosyltransferase family 4 protein [Candidatus Desulfofervidaceae bacterium]
GIVKMVYPKFRLIRTRHLSTPIGKNPLSRLIYNILPDAVITTGEAIREKMIKYNRFNPDKIISIPTGVDLERFDPKKVQPVLNKGSFLIGMVSVLRSWKGHKYFISAVPEILKQIPKAKFYIVGDGPQKENIWRQIEQMGLENKVFMLGYRKDVPEILASLNIIVHPSTGHEGVPQTILQALAMQKPIVTTNVGGIPEVIQDHYTGILIPPCDSQAIAQAVINLFKNPVLSKKLGENGRRLVEKYYSFEAMLDKVERVYADV